MKTYLVRPHAEEKQGGRCKLRGPGSLKRAPDETRGGGEGVGEEPSQVLVCKKDGLTVQEEKTYR
jgi:hypothetical protein